MKSFNVSHSRVFARVPPAIMVAMAFFLAFSAYALAADDESIKVTVEVEVYFEAGSTNFDGDYNTDKRGKKFWGSYFGDGLGDSYSYTETRVKEAELKFKKDTALGEAWTLTNEIEIEFKTINAGRKANDYDLEEMSATFKHTSGLYIALGILEDKKLYEGGLVMESASEDAKGFDENPGIRVGYKTSHLDLDVRFSSIFNEEEYEDSTENDHDKVVNQTHLRFQAEIKLDMVQAMGTYTSVTSGNKEEGDFQAAKASLGAADFDAFKATGLDTYSVLGLGAMLTLGAIQPTLTFEQWSVELDDGASEYETTIVTAGVRIKQVGPGNLVMEIENGTSDISGGDVTFTALSAEYHWTQGKSKWGPGIKSFSNDAPGEKLTGTVGYFGGEWIF